jgi:hypothetical protein
MQTRTLIICLQIKSHSSSVPRPAPRPTTQPSQRRQQSSRDILGLNQHLLPTQDNTVEAEVDRYLSDPVIETSALKFWQVCNFHFQYLNFHGQLCLQDAKQRYSQLYPLAMDVLPIQASSVPCERVFSSGKETMAPRRQKIKPALMEKLQMLKYGIRKGTQLNFTEGMSWAKELIEIEELHKDSIPSDVFSYIKSLGVEEKEEQEQEQEQEEEEEAEMGDVDDDDDDDDDDEVEEF